MGVDGLIKFLQPIISKEHLSTFKNQRAAVDMMSWIYRCCYNAAQQMRSEPQSSAFLFYINQMLDLLQHYNIKAICVFDGRFVSGKQDTVNKRKNIKEQNYKKSKQLLQKGQQEQSKKYLNRCISINEHIICQTMKALKVRKIDFIVAPYEADAQMAKLYRLQMVDFVICQDSDLIIYGIPVLLKLSNQGDCDYFDINKINVQELEIENVFVKQFLRMDKMKRTEVAILTGTDYLPSIKGIGIKRAIKFMVDNANISEAIQKIKLNDKYRTIVPEDYQQKVQQSKLIFLLATSYNPKKKCLELLDQNYADEVISEEMTIQKLRSIVGSFYQYDQDVCNGLKNVWTFQKRDLSVLPFKRTSSINQSVLKEKEMTLENSKIIRRLNSTNSTVVLQSLEMTQQLISMCQSRKLKQKIQLMEKMSQQSQQAEHRNQQEVQKVEDEKMKQFKQKFPEWMKYSPREK